MSERQASIFVALFAISAIFALASIAVANGFDGFIISGSGATIGAIAGYYAKQRKE